MKLTTVTEALVLPTGTAIEFCCGTVAQVGRWSQGVNTYGPWTIQNITIGDETKKIKVKLINQQELLPDWLGHTIYLTSGNRQGRLIGLKVEIDKYPREETPIIAANEKASISDTPPTGGEITQAQPAPEQIAPRRAPAQDPDSEVPDEYAPVPQMQPSVPQALPFPQAVSKDVDARKAWASTDAGLNRLRRIRLRTLAVAHRIQQDALAMGCQISADHMEKIDTWLAIEAGRQGIIVGVPDCDPPSPHAQ